MSHTATLVLAYAAACLGWWGLSRVVPLWQTPERPVFSKPWVEVGIVLGASVGVLGLGQLWSHGIRLEVPGPWSSVVESLNQALIFSPILLVPVLRRQGWSSAWVQPAHLVWRVAAGLALAGGVLLVYSTAEAGAPGWTATLGEVFRTGHLHLAVQVLFEDLAIAIVFVRIAAALSPRVAIGTVAVLFAAAHVPAMLTAGVTGGEFVGLIRDMGLGILVLGTLWRGADIAWFWPVHFALDMTQFLTRAS